MGIMKRSTIAILSLSGLLVGTNAFWLYKMVDAGISYTYLQSSYDGARGTALQALALLPEVASQSTSRQAAIDAVQRIQPEATPFEKDGFVWVGNIGLRFDSAGRLIDARATTEPF